jgi:hypothetical protein
MSPSTSAEALNKLQIAEGAAKNPTDYLTSANKSMGVDTAQNTVTGLQGAISNTTRLLSQVAPSVMGRTANSLVTSAQANKQISNEQAPLSATLNTQGTEYNQANTNLSQLRTAAQNAATGEYTGQQNKLSYLQNLYNTMYKQEQDAATAAETLRKEEEAKRQFDIQAAQNQQKIDNSTSNPTTSDVKYNYTPSAQGGFTFYADGAPITAAQYIEGKGGNMIDLVNLLSKSKDAGDEQIINDINNGASQMSLEEKYPWVFGVA